LEKLKKITLDECKLIPEERIKNWGSNFVKRLKKIIKIVGNRLEEYHLRKIRREALKEKTKLKMGN